MSECECVRVTYSRRKQRVSDRVLVLLTGRSISGTHSGGCVERVAARERRRTRWPSSAASRQTSLVVLALFSASGGRLLPASCPHSLTHTHTLTYSVHQRPSGGHTSLLPTRRPQRIRGAAAMAATAADARRAAAVLLVNDVVFVRSRCGPGRPVV